MLLISETTLEAVRSAVEAVTHERNSGDGRVSSPAVDALLDVVADLEDEDRDLRAEVERLCGELDAIGGMRVVEHEGCRLRVITSALHDRLCAWRVATPQGTDPEVLGCAGCGFCYPLVAVTGS